jgi:peptidoglycan/LPS O-acetylase OafA/YrhL
VPAGSGPPRLRHITALDGLRGFAVVLVVLSHFAPGVAPGGFLGVDLFFVLSGFLITSLLVAEREATNRVSLRNFWIRRARRLFPALLVMVGVVLVVSWLTEARHVVHQVGADGLSALLYVANWRFILSGESYIRQFVEGAPSPLRHTWSLAIEEQFYIIWPLAFVALAALARRVGWASRKAFRRLLGGMCTVFAALSFARLVIGYHQGMGLDRLYYGTDSRIFLILLGAALGAVAAGTPALPERLRRWRPALIALGATATIGLLAATAVVTTEQSWLYAGGMGLIALALLVVLVAAAQPSPNPLARFFELKPLVGLGLISYGVYLWHWPVAIWVRSDNLHLDGPALFVLRCLLTLGVALLSYRFVEQPVRRGWLPHVGPIGPVFTSVSIVSGVLVSLAVPVLVHPSTPAVPTDAAGGADPAPATLEYATAPRCDDPAAAAAPPLAGELLVQLEGNSIAGEVSDCLRTILSERGVALERVDPPDFLLCRDLPAIEEQVRDPATRPDAGVIFLFAAYDDRCGLPWYDKVEDLLDVYRRYDVHAYLVPTVPMVPGGRDDLAPGPLQEYDYYRQVAEARPDEATFIDAGRYMRDTAGQYRWRMPCVSPEEPGCDGSATVGVRFIDGLHFCTDPDFAAHGCQGAQHQAGERRVAAGIAEPLLQDLETRFG